MERQLADGVFPAQQSAAPAGKMLAEILRFNRLATRIAREGDEARLRSSIEVFLDEHGFGTAFRQDYLLPMMGCIWSCPTDQMLRFPVATLIRFCHNHGLIQVSTDRPSGTPCGAARASMCGACWPRCSTMAATRPV
jgi:predicted NAD/FAD-binding protein